MSLYDVSAYGKMVADHRRLDAYRRALEKHVSADTTVLDLGTGTGVHALMCCVLGAAHVWAVEPASIVQTARQIARDNGFADRITFLQLPSTRVDLPAPADVLVSDLRGVLPMFGRHIPSIIDARRRLLADGGVLIPGRDVLWASVVDAADVYDGIAGPWDSSVPGIDMSAARALATNSVHSARFAPEQLLAEAVRWGELDYVRVEDADIDATVELTVRRDGTAHGVAAWFDAELADDVLLSNAPGEPETVYGTAFFPFEEAVDVGEGARLTVELAAHLLDDDYLWRWNTSIEPAGGGAPHRFRQSTFHGAPLSPESLHRSAVDHKPRLSEEGRIDLEILAMIDGQTPIDAIAERLMDRFPERFRARRSALRRVVDVALRAAR